MSDEDPSEQWVYSEEISTNVSDQLYDELIDQDDLQPSLEELRASRLMRSELGKINAILRHIFESDKPTDNLSIDNISKRRFAGVFDIYSIEKTDVTDNYSEYVDHMAKDAEPVLNFLLYTRAHDANINEMYNIVNDDDDLQQLLGFSSLPSKPTFYKAKNERFEMSESDLSELAERCAFTAKRAGYEIPEDVEQWLLFRRGEIDKESGETPIEKKISSIREYLAEEIIPEILSDIDLRRAHNTSHDTEVFFGFLANLARNSWSGSSGSIHTAYQLDVEVPRVNTLNGHITKYEIPDPDQFQSQAHNDIKLLEIFRNSNDKIFKSVLRKNEVETNSVAIDTTNWRWYSEEAPWNLGVKPRQNTATAWQFICLSLVETERRFVIGTLPVNSKKNYPDLSRSLIERVQEYADPQYVYFDSEFYNSNIIETCRELGINYLIRAKSYDKIQKLEEKVKKSNNDAKIKRDVDFAGLKVSPDLVAVQLDEERVGYSEETQTTSYITDITGFNPDPMDLHYRFDDRWSIESAFNQIKNRFLPQTESPQTEVRVFYFLTAVLFYNLYQLSKLDLAESAPGVQNGFNHTSLDFLTAVVEECLDDT